MHRIFITTALFVTLPTIAVAHTDLHADRGVTAYLIAICLAVLMGVAIWASVQNRR